MKRKLTAGQTSVALPIFIQDTSSTTGGGLGSLVFNTASLVAEYRRRGQSAWTAITLQTTTLGTWVTGGFIADGALTGAYELDLPDAVCAASARWVAVRLRGAANMLPVLIEIELDAFDYQTATQPVNTTQFAGQTITAAAGVTIPSSISSYAGGAVASVSGSVGSVVAAVVLDSGVTDQLDAMEAAIALLRVSESRVVERSLSDTNAITFAWPVSGATITATRSIDNAVYGAVQGAIAFLRTESSKHYYTLAFDADDRPAAEGQVRYKLVDGTYTRYVVLRTVNLVTVAQVNAQVLDVLSVDTFGELGSPPASTSSLKDKLVWLFMWARNKATATSSQRKLFADDTTTVVSTETITDDGTTFTKGESL